MATTPPSAPHEDQRDDATTIPPVAPPASAATIPATATAGTSDSTITERLAALERAMGLRTPLSAPSAAPTPCGPISLGSSLSPSTISAMRLPSFTSSTATSLPLLAITQPSASLSIPASMSTSISATSTTLATSTTPTTSATPIPGNPNLPAKLVQKIISWEYVDLSELLPEQLNQFATPTTSTIVVLPESAYDSQRRKKRQIQSIAMWVQVFSTYMLVLGTRHPEIFPELIAYQLIIVQHSQKFRYPSWLHYDIEFRRWAAHSKSRKWSEINPQCYALAFTGQGSALPWCPTCQVDGGSHALDCPRFSSRSSSQRPVPTPQQYSHYQLQPLIHNPPPLLPSPQAKRSTPDHCLLYNKRDGGCPYGSDCKFKHRCSLCRTEGHPVTRCPDKHTA